MEFRILLGMLSYIGYIYPTPLFLEKEKGNAHIEIILQ
jgi:hypothetical protein